jgi:diguanylate cyclase (GGDEF)-like protein
VEPLARRFGDVALERVASYGLVAVLLAVSAVALWSSVSTSRLGKEAIASSVLAEHYASAASAMKSQESLERKYRLEPSAVVRLRYQQAGVDLRIALSQVDRFGGPADQAIVGRVLKLHGPYLVATSRMFDAVDRGDEAEVLRIDNEDADPKFDVIEQAVNLAADERHAQALGAMEALRDRDIFNARAVPAVLAVGLILALLFSSVLRRTLEALKRHGEQAMHDALHDALTALPNRTLLADRFEHALRADQREGSATGLLLIDLDRFKEVNDTLGHHSGDGLLVEIGKRLSNALREVDTIARLGGDEFAVLLPKIDGVEGALLVARRLRTALIQPFVLEGIEVAIDASIGVVVSRLHGDDPVTLLQRADVAMYAAKLQGQGVLAYDPDADLHTPERLQLLGQLRMGIERNELFLEYQPKLSLSTGRVTGVEALVRWQHPIRGLVRPDLFIPFAEHTALIGPLTKHVLDLALAQTRAWMDMGHRIPVAVNISARNLLDEQIVDQVRDLLARHRLPADMLALEVTESAIMLEPKKARCILSQLHGLGVRLSIDDFGAGYTSLGQLKDLPVSELKVDKSFVLTMHTDRSNAIIVHSVVALGHSLGLSVVAEGVETADALETLTGYQCDVAQGYHLCRPKSAEAFMDWYRRRPTSSTGPSPLTVAEQDRRPGREISVAEPLFV